KKCSGERMVQQDGDFTTPKDTCLPKLHRLMMIYGPNYLCSVGFQLWMTVF
ncbi:hypothetical protein BOX15_Mlig021020g1, partial [Macrostomum lignano]